MRTGLLDADDAILSTSIGATFARLFMSRGWPTTPFAAPAARILWTLSGCGEPVGRSITDSVLNEAADPALSTSTVITQQLVSLDRDSGQRIRARNQLH